MRMSYTDDQRADQDRATLYARIKELEDMLFARGAMAEPPCFVCGYSGAGYYQPDTHPCAKRHHAYAMIRARRRTP